MDSSAINLPSPGRRRGRYSDSESAKLNGLDPYEYLRDVLTRLPTHNASRIAELLPDKWAGVSEG